MSLFFSLLWTLFSFSPFHAGSGYAGHQMGGFHAPAAVVAAPHHMHVMDSIGGGPPT